LELAVTGEVNVIMLEGRTAGSLESGRNLTE
jgi:hypothetical protein